MPRPSRSLDVLLSEFNALRASLAPHASDLQKLKEDYVTRRSALKRLRETEQSEDNVEQSEIERTICATESNYSKYHSLVNLDKKIGAR